MSTDVGESAPHGSVVTLTASPSPGWRFIRWEGAVQTSENPLKVEVNEDVTLTAIFERAQFRLTILQAGEGGVREQVLETAKRGDYPFEARVQLTADPADGWMFAEWRGDVQGDENPTQILMDANKEVTAVFEQPSWRWEPVYGPRSEPGLFVFGKSSDDLWVVWERGTITQSADQGETWNDVPFPSACLGCHNVRLAVSPEGVLYVAASESDNSAALKVFRSSNAGATWSDVTPADTLLSGDHFADRITISSEGAVFVGADDGHVMRSTDGGANWTPVSTVWNEKYWRDGEPRFLHVGPGDALYVGFVGGELYRSTDLGDTWTRFGSTESSLAFVSLAVTSEERVLLGGVAHPGINRAGVFELTSSSEHLLGLEGNPVIKLLVASDGRLFAGTDGSGVFLSENNGASWRTLNDGLPDQAYVRDLFYLESGGVFAIVYAGGQTRAYRLQAATTTSKR